MKHAAFIQKGENSQLKSKVEEWIKENKDQILEIIDIEYEEDGDIFTATITYLD